MLEARTVLQGEVPTGCVGNTIRCIGQGEGKNGKKYPVRYSASDACWKPVRYCKEKSRPVGLEIPYGVGQGKEREKYPVR